jgi:hypothetical protein
MAQSAQLNAVLSERLEERKSAKQGGRGMSYITFTLYVMVR